MINMYKKLIVTKVPFWGRYVRKSLQDKVQNEVTKDEAEVQNNRRQPGYTKMT
jgi:hypothetical protein